MRLRISIALTALLLLVGGTCNVNAPKSDTTPPTMSWVVIDRDTGAKTELAKDATFDATNGKRFNVTLRVDDPEGVLRIHLIETFKAPACVAGGVETPFVTVGSKAIADDVFPQNGKATSQAIVFDEVNLDVCGQGTLHGTLELEGSGQNYFAGNVGGILTFTF